MTLLEEGVEGPAQAIILELVGRDVGEDIGPGLLRPAGDVDQRRRLTQPCRQQQAQHLAVGVLQLRIGRQMAIDNRFDVELVERRLDQGQRPGVDNLLRGRSATPGNGSHRDPPGRSRQTGAGMSRGG